MSLRLVSLTVLVLVAAGTIAVAQGQQPRTVELDAATIAARTEAARQLIPLLEPVKEKASARYDTGKGTVPDSPFAGTQTTAVAITIGKKKPVEPRVIQAMDRLLEWEPGDRTSAEDAALFDAWLAQLSRRASSIATKRGAVSCDTGCVVQTITALDEAWGKDERQREANRDEMLLETFTEAVRGRK
jgi:hypothetical protein